MHLYCSFDTTAAWKKLCFILSVRSDFHMTDSLSISVHAFASHEFISAGIGDTASLVVNLSTSFKEPPFSVELSLVWLIHIYSVLCPLTWRPMSAAAHSKLCSRLSAWAGALVSSTMSSALLASVIVCAGYLLFLSFDSFKTFLFYFINHHHHPHVAPPARISLTLSCHFSLSFIASGRSSGLHPVSSHSCCM